MRSQSWALHHTGIVRPRSWAKVFPSRPDSGWDKIVGSRGFLAYLSLFWYHFCSWILSIHISFGSGPFNNRVSTEAKLAFAISCLIELSQRRKKRKYSLWWNEVEDLIFIASVANFLHPRPGHKRLSQITFERKIRMIIKTSSCAYGRDVSKQVCKDQMPRCQSQCLVSGHVTLTRHRLGYFRTHDRLGVGSDPPPRYLENQSSCRAPSGGIRRLSTRYPKSILKSLRLC